MKFIDFFAGIGGFRLGMEMAGHECVGHCEIDKFADRSYRAMHDVKEDEWYADDICRVEPGELPEADIWTGGFPCQAFSIAGKRRGFEDMRGTLIFEIFRLAAERKPKILFLENVKGLLNHEGGEPSESSSMDFGNLGMMSNGKCLILKTSAFRRTGKGCSLSDILEREVDEKYFLSDKATERLMNYRDQSQTPLRPGPGETERLERTLLKINSRHKK